MRGFARAETRDDCWHKSARSRIVPFITKEQPTKYWGALLAVLLIASVGGVVAGCGGESSESSAASDGEGFTVQASTTMEPSKLSKAQFIARSNKYCQEAWPIIIDNFAQYSGTLDEKESEKKRLSRAIRLSLMAGIDFHIFDNLHFLGAPKGEKAETEEIIGALQEAVERGQRLGPLYSAAEVLALFSAYNQLAQQYGLNNCLVNKAHLTKIKALSVN